MKKAALTVSLLLLSGAAAYAGPFQPSQFEHKAALKGEFVPDTPASVNLPVGLVSKTTSRFSDLRLFDDTGQEVPYVIYGETEPGEKVTSFNFKVLSYEETDNEVTVVVERPVREGAYDRIEIVTPARDFKKKIQVLTSLDNGNEIPSEWLQYTDDSLFDFSSNIDLRKTRIHVSSTSSRYLKLILTDDRPAANGEQTLRLKYDGLEFEVGGMKEGPFRVDRIRGWRGKSRAGSTVLDTMTVEKPVRTINDSGDSIYFLGAVNLPVTSVTLQVEKKYFHRRVVLLGSDGDQDDDYREITSGTVYNIPGMDEPSVTVTSPARSYQYLRLKVINRDNPPLEIRKVDLHWPRSNLYFIPEKGRSYSLYFKGEEISRPSYELGQIIQKDPVRLVTYQELVLGEIKNNDEFSDEEVKPEREMTERAIFKIIILILVFGLSWWLFSLMRKLPKSEV